tara:strand:+ start:1028 stop:1438 length:411 start_codon:yes stop_codon:yes gene_type:complete
MRTEAIKELIDNFSLFEDWEERYAYLIELGQALPELSEAEKVDLNKVEGCVSQVWMVAEPRDNALYFRATSDAILVKGLIAVLDKAYQGVSLAHLDQVDIEAIFADLGLDSNISPNRRNGFFSMVEKIKLQKVDMY